MNKKHKKNYRAAVEAIPNKYILYVEQKDALGLTQVSSKIFGHIHDINFFIAKFSDKKLSQFDKVYVRLNGKIIKWFKK